MTVAHRALPRAFPLTAPLLVAVALYTHTAFAFAQPQEEGVPNIDVVPCTLATPGDFPLEVPSGVQSGVPLLRGEARVESISSEDEFAACDPNAYLGLWATEGPVANFVLNNQAYWGTYGGYSGQASNVLNYCTGFMASSRTSTSPGSWPFCYYCSLVVDLLDHVYQCGYYRILGWGYVCNDRFNGDLYKNFLDQGYRYVATGVWYKVSPAISVTATDASNGWVTTVAPSGAAATTYTIPVHDRRGGHNSPIKVYNIAISSAVATNIKIETFYDGMGAGHAHTSGRPLKDYDLTQANQLGALFGGKNRTGGLVGTAMTFRLGASETRTISYQTTGFAGIETVRFTYNDNLPQFRAGHDWRIEAKVNYLEPLEYGPEWNNYGETPEHSNSHYGTGSFNSFLRRFGFLYYGWTGGGNNGNPEKLRYNDMALEFGGPFDVDGDWYNHRNHENHRDGVSMDLSKQVCRPWVSDYDCQMRVPDALQPINVWVAWNAWTTAEAEYRGILPGLQFWEEEVPPHYHFQANY